jgi:hypothetical protein
MKRLTATLLLFVGFVSSAHAESYYCVPTQQGYECEPAGEIRDYPNGKTSEPTFNGFIDKFRCKKSGEDWVCKPFEPGAIVMEPEHKCTDVSKITFSPL